MKYKIMHVTKPEGHKNQDTKKAELALIHCSSMRSREKRKKKTTTIMVNVLHKQTHKSIKRIKYTHVY